MRPIPTRFSYLLNSAPTDEQNLKPPLHRSKSLQNPYPHLKLLDEIHSLQIVIPIFQRKYCWSKQQCLHFWDMEAGRHLGKLLLFHRLKGTRSWPRQHLECIDGQQRVMTCLILLCSMRDRLFEIMNTSRSSREKSTAKILHDYIMNHLLLNQDTAIIYYRSDHPLDMHAIKPIVKVLPALDDQEEMFTILFAKPHDQQKQSWIYSAKEVFDECLKTCSLNRVNALLHTLLKEVNFLHLDLDSDTDVAHMYQQNSLMSQVNKMRFKIPFPGVDMSHFDMVRNRVLSELSSEEAQIEVYHEYWMPLENSFSEKKLHERRMLDEYLNHFLNSVSADPQEREKQRHLQELNFASMHKMQQFMAIATGKNNSLSNEFASFLDKLLKKEGKEIEDASTRRQIIEEMLKQMQEQQVLFLQRVQDVPEEQ